MDATASVPHERSTFFFRFVQATTLFSLFCLVYLTIDFVLHPFDPPANGAFPAVFRIVYMLLLMPVTLLIGFLIVRRVPDNLIGWFLLNWGCNLSFVAMRVGLDPFWDVMKSLVGNGIGWISLLYILLLFPDGIAFPRRLHSWLMLSYMLIVCSYCLFTLSSPITMTADLGDANPLFIPALARLNAISMQLANVLGLQLTLFLPFAIFRYRCADATARRQLRWLTFSVGIFVALLVPGAVYRALTGDILDQIDFSVVFYSFILAFPVIATGNAILRHGLYSIDVIINRTLVYALLVFGIFVMYAALIGVWSRLFGTGSSFEVSLIGAGMIAFVFQPFRAFIQRAVNRLMFGRRNEPMTVIDQLGKALEATLSPESSLYHLVKTTAETLKLPYTAVESDARTLALFGKKIGEPVGFPLVYQAQLVGQLVVTARSPNEHLNDADCLVLENVARQASSIVYAARLSADLQVSRQRIVTAREEERRRLRRDLHDGLGPTLATLTLQAEAARDLMVTDPGKSGKLLDEIIAGMQKALTEIRSIVYALRPPALDDLGLIAAINVQAVQYTSDQLMVRVELPEHLPPLPAAVEVAAYRIVQEALTNVVRHAQAKTCVVRLAIKDTVQFDIQDDGKGIAAARRAGVGLNAMHERAVELGGTCNIKSAPGEGTHISVTLPARMEA